MGHVWGRSLSRWRVLELTLHCEALQKGLVPHFLHHFFLKFCPIFYKILIWQLWGKERAREGGSERAREGARERGRDGGRVFIGILDTEIFKLSWKIHFSKISEMTPNDLKVPRINILALSKFLGTSNCNHAIMYRKRMSFLSSFLSFGSNFSKEVKKEDRRNVPPLRDRRQTDQQTHRLLVK